MNNYINRLPLEIIQLISFNLYNIYDLNDFMASNKLLYTNADDIFYMIWARNMYSDEFWNKASKRTKCLTKPFISMKIELLRIEKFQNYLIKKRHIIWEKKDFYRYWQSLENNLSKHKNLYY